MRRVVTAVCLLALAGCGSTDSSTATFKGEEAAVAEVIEDLQAAAERREGDRICKEILAEDLINELQQGDVNCTEELDQALKEADHNDLEVTSVAVTGTTAEATVKGKDGTTDRVATFGLAKERGAWRITSLG
jgi:hypothetical protein